MRTRSAFFVAPAPSRLLGVLSLCCLPLIGCGDDQARPAADEAARRRDAIRRVFELDVALAKPRDQAMATKKLTAAVARMRQYVAAATALDFSALPEDLRTAYARHLDAWRVAADLVEHYSGFTGTLRATIDGDAYALGRIDAAQKAVEQTWAEVKAKAKAHGVDAPG